jgi:predicted dehydrogenase
VTDVVGVPGVAIVGCGLIGRKRAAALPAGSVRAVHDVATAAAAALAVEIAATGPTPLVAPDLASACRAPGVGLVVVATSHDGLAPAAAAALDAGCHVLVEKPAGRSLAEVVALAERARAVGLQVRVGYNHRFHPAVEKAREIVDGHDLGALLHVRGRYGHGGRVGYEREWRAQRERSGGGELVDQGSHLLDLFGCFAGSPTLAYAELRTAFWPMEVEDNAFLAVHGADGALGWLHASWTEWKNLFSFELTYERAKLELAGLGGSYGTERLTWYAMRPEMGPPPTTAWEWPGPDRSWDDEVGDVLVALQGGAARGAGIDDAIAVWRVVDEAQRRAGAAVGHGEAP